MGSRVEPGTLLAMKQRGEPITMLTCYDYPTALLEEAADVDVIFVGDSVGINMLGYESPQQVTMEDMIHHTGAVRRGVQKALLMSDLPYHAYEAVEQAVENAQRLVNAGAEVVKLEGAQRVVDSMASIVSKGIPAIGHVGHTPQTSEGRRRVFGDRADEAAAVLEDARALEAAGALAVVLECVPERVAGVVTERLSIPTIGIGAGRRCDGQVLVAPDLLGLNDFTFRYSKRYADLSTTVEKAFAAYIADVKAHRYPEKEHRYLIKTEELRKFQAMVEG